MKLKTYGRVLCTYEHSGGGLMSTVGYQSATALSGTDRADDIARRLKKLGYRMDLDTSKPGKALFFGPHDVEAFVTVWDSSHQGTKWNFDDSKTCEVPKAGITVVSLQE